MSFVQDGPNPIETVADVTNSTISGFKFDAIAITHGLNCAPEPFGVPSPFSYGVRAAFVLLGVLAMVWPAMTPRFGIVVVSTILIVVQTRLPYFQPVQRVSESE